MRSFLISACVVGVTALTACAAYPDINGQLALSREGTHPLVLIHTCHGAVDEIQVFADRENLPPEQTNASLGHLRARHPVSGDVTVDLSDPGPDWEVISPVTLPADPHRGIIVTAREASANTEMRQVTGRVGELSALECGAVLVAGAKGDGSSRPTTTQSFLTAACSR